VSAPILLTLAFNVLAGFNDGGNLMATVLPSRVRPAFLWIWLTVVVSLGPLLLGTRVAATIVHGIVALPRERPELPAMVLAALATVVLSWWRRLPTSMSLALVGAMVGGSVAGPAAIRWAGVARVLVGFVLTVVVGFVLGHLALVAAARGHRWLPRGVAGHLLLVAMATLLGAAYGGNDMEKAIGLLVLGGQSLRAAIWLAVASFSLGTLLGAWRVARTVGTRLWRLRPLEALLTQFATAVGVGLASLVGIPVSTSQTVDAAILGVGSAENPKHLGWRTARAMVASWVITPPLAFAMGVLFRWALVRP
jgi:PiT family inorganic phosphate transporter